MERKKLPRWPTDPPIAALRPQAAPDTESALAIAAKELASLSDENRTLRRECAILYGLLRERDSTTPKQTKEQKTITKALTKAIAKELKPTHNPNKGA